MSIDDRSTDHESIENDPRDVTRLPPLGEGIKPENWGKVTNFLDQLALKAVAHYTTPCDRADTNLTVLETGKSTVVHEKDVIANKIRQDMLTMMAALMRDAVTRKIVAEEMGEPPELVPFLDRQTMSFQQFEVNDAVESEFEQRVVDWHWQEAELDADVWMALFNARTAGWYTAPFEWNWQKMLPTLRTNISVRQIPLDPAAGPLKAVETANWAFLRWRVNWWQARALFPQISLEMAQRANEGPQASDSVLPMGKNEQSGLTGERMVDLSFFWHRNYPVQAMTPEEAVAYGEVELRATRPVGEDDPPLPSEGADQGQPQLDGAADSAGTQTEPPAGVQGLPTSSADGEIPVPGGDGGMPDPNTFPSDPSVQGPVSIGASYFLPNGTKPITPADPEWPWWLGIRQIARVQNAVAQDCICPYFDIPLLHMPANPLPMSACGQGDPEAMQKIQEGHIRALTNAVEHSDLMAHPVKVMCKSAHAVLPDKYKTDGASIAGMTVIIDDDLYEKLGGKADITNDAPPISASLGQILEILGNERQDITPAPNALSGRQTGDITGWQSTKLLQDQASSKFDLPAMFLQLMVKRLMKFVRHAVLWFVPIEKLQQICSDYPPEVVEALVRRGRANDRNIEVIINLSSGGAQDRKKSELVQQFNIVDDQPNSPTFGQRVVGLKTLREGMGVDSRKEDQNQNAQGMMMNQMAQQQAQQAAIVAKSQPKPRENGNGNGQPQEAGSRFA